MLAWIILALLAITCSAPEVDGQCFNNEHLETPDDVITVKSPNFPQDYASNLSCEWKFALKETHDIKTFRIEFVTFQLQHSWGCNNDYLEILSVVPGQNWSNLTAVGKWCSGSPKHLDVFTDFVIRFHSDSDRNNKGFELKIVPQRDFNFCRNFSTQKLQAVNSTRYLYSPGYPTGYLKNTRCSWRLEAPDGEVVIVESIGWIDTSSYHDLVVILGAGNKTIYFWNTQHVFATSTGNVLDIQFSTGSRGSAKGFVLKYSSSNPPENITCTAPGNQTVFAYEKPSLLSLDIPDTLWSCYWTLKARTDEVVVLETIGWTANDLNEGTNYGSHYTVIYDGPSSKNTLIVHHAGSRHPFGMVRSSGQDLFLEAYLERNYYLYPEATWWTMKFSSRHELDLNENYLPAFRVYSTIWVPALRSQISSPYWKIHATVPGKCIWAKALDRSLRFHESYQRYFAAYDGVNASAPQLDFCHRFTPQYAEGSQQMRIQVDSDSTMGFWLRFSLRSCRDINDILYKLYPGLHSVIQVPADNRSVSPYPANVMCRWEIGQYGYSNVIHLASIDTRLKSSVDCHKDYIEVYDGKNTAIPLIKWCGGSNPNITSTTSRIILVFRLDAVEAWQGFKVMFSSQKKEVCSSEVTASKAKQYLSSPGYPHSPYSNNLDCIWHIRAQIDSAVIKLEITELSLDDDYCVDYIVIYDAWNQRKIDTLCGVTNGTSSFTSTGPRMHIEFRTDYMGTSRGFRFAYYLQDKTDLVQPDTCSPDLELIATLENQTFTSPYYPMKYDNNMTCLWRIHPFNRSYVVQIQVLDSALEYSPTCSQDFVQVYDGRGNMSKNRGRWCGKSTPRFSSTEMYTTLIFESDSQRIYKGFRIQYWAILPSTSSTGKSSGSSTAVIVGGVMGGLAAILIIVVSIFCILRWKKRSSGTRSSQNPVSFNETNSTAYEVTPVNVSAIDHVNISVHSPVSHL